MAQHPGNINVRLSVELDKLAEQVGRRVTAMKVAVELSSQVTPEQIESVLEKFRADEGHAKSESDLRWIREITPQWERMVTDGLAWLIAAQEYADSITQAACPADCDYDPAVADSCPTWLHSRAVCCHMHPAPMTTESESAAGERECVQAMLGHPGRDLPKLLTPAEPSAANETDASGLTATASINTQEG